MCPPKMAKPNMSKYPCLFSGQPQFFPGCRECHVHTRYILLLKLLHTRYIWVWQIRWAWQGVVLQNYFIVLLFSLLELRNMQTLILIHCSWSIGLAQGGTEGEQVLRIYYYTNRPNLNCIRQKIGRWTSAHQKFSPCTREISSKNSILCRLVIC